MSARRSTCALHPTQLYESAAGLVILVALLLLEKRPGHFAGRTFWSFAFLYAVLRFIIEFYRGDDRGLVFNAVSTSQFISIVLAPLSIFMLWYLSRPTTTQAEPAEALARSSQAAVRVKTTRLQFTADADHAGDRLDRFLTAQVPDFSRSQIQRLIESGHVTHSRHAKVKPNSDIREGDVDQRRDAGRAAVLRASPRICHSTSSSTTPTSSSSTSPPEWWCIPRPAIRPERSSTHCSITSRT